MNFSERILEWLALPTFELPRYECTDCGERATEEHDACPSCGGELEADERVPAFDYWGPMH